MFANLLLGIAKSICLILGGLCGLQTFVDTRIDNTSRAIVGCMSVIYIILAVNL
jgi:hypothetical protein